MDDQEYTIGDDALTIIVDPFEPANEDDIYCLLGIHYVHVAEVSAEIADIFSSTSDGLTHTFQTDDGTILSSADSETFTVTLSLEITSCTGT